jgi:hypothetical protein
MTIDSTYKPELNERHEGVEYAFSFESIGEEAVKVYILRDDGSRIQLSREGETEYVQY